MRRWFNKTYRNSQTTHTVSGLDGLSHPVVLGVAEVPDHQIMPAPWKPYTGKPHIDSDALRPLQSHEVGPYHAAGPKYVYTTAMQHQAAPATQATPTNDGPDDEEDATGPVPGADDAADTDEPRPVTYAPGTTAPRHPPIPTSEELGDFADDADHTDVVTYPIKPRTARR